MNIYFSVFFVSVLVREFLGFLPHFFQRVCIAVPLLGVDFSPAQEATPELLSHPIARCRQKDVDKALEAYRNRPRYDDGLDDHDLTGNDFPTLAAVLCPFEDSAWNVGMWGLAQGRGSRNCVAFCRVTIYAPSESDKYVDANIKLQSYRTWCGPVRELC